MSAADLSATLAEIRERAETAADFPLAEMAKFTDPGVSPAMSVAAWIATSALDVPLLLAAIDAVLKLADDWRAVGCPESAEEEALMWQRIECGEALREAITRELSGTRQTQPGEDGES